MSEEVEQPEDVGPADKTPSTTSLWGRRLSQPWPVALLSGVLLFVLGIMINSCAHRISASNELHNYGARYNISGFTIWLTSLKCTPSVPAPFSPPQAPSQTCTANFVEINNTNRSARLTLNFYLYVGSSIYSNQYSEDDADVFPNTRTNRVEQFVIAPGTAPTKLKLTPTDTDFWADFIPLYHRQFVYDLR